MKKTQATILGIICLLLVGCATNRHDAIYEDKYYSEGSIMLQEGMKMKATKGKWEPVL